MLLPGSKFQPANEDLLFLQVRPKPQEMMNCRTFSGCCLTEHFSKRGKTVWAFTREGKWWQELMEQDAPDAEWMYCYSRTGSGVKAA